MARRKFLVIAIVVGLALAVVSFVGGAVGAIIADREPLSIFDVATPHVELAAGKPFPGLPITNTMIAAWITLLVLFALFFAATRRMKLIPTGLQNLIEFLYETVAGFIEGIAGKENGRRFLPFVLTIFLFVLVNAWIGLVPGFESIKLNGMPLLRNANTDINVPLMLALVSVVAIEYWGFKAKGISYLKTFVNFGPLSQGFVQLFKGRIKAGVGGIFNGIAAAFVGILEVLSHLIRVISFTFRLFGNMTAGLVLTGVVIFIVPLVIPSIFYGLEALFGFVQALIFGGLTLVFGYAAVMSAEE
jgi:F-type H+-transporting ATPase subunit a